MVLVVLFLYFNVFMFILDRNTAFQDTASQVAQMDVDRSEEQVATSTAYIKPGANQIEVNCTFNNTGPIAVQIVSLWANDANANSYNRVVLSSTALQPWNGTQIDKILVVNGAKVTDTQVTAWFVTARGNLVSITNSTSGTTSGVSTYRPPWAIANPQTPNPYSDSHAVNQTTTATSVSVTISHIRAYDVIYAAAALKGTNLPYPNLAANNQLTPSDNLSPRLSWTKRISGDNPSAHWTGHDAEIYSWYAIATVDIPSLTITFTSSNDYRTYSNYGMVILAFTIGGADITAQPLEPNGAAFTSNGYGSRYPVGNSYTTSRNNETVVGIVASAYGGYSPSAMTSYGWAQLDSIDAGADEYQTVGIAPSGATAAFDYQSTGCYWIMITDGFVPLIHS
jgi:hypothetical protein